MPFLLGALEEAQGRGCGSGAGGVGGGAEEKEKEEGTARTGVIVSFGCFGSRRACLLSFLSHEPCMSADIALLIAPMIIGF